jgi:tetratricopeptide (TPR) repeat protein
LALASAAAGAESAKTLEWSTKSEAARKQLAEVRRLVEVFGAPQAQAEKLVAADPEWCMGEYYLSAVATSDNQKHLDRSVELAKKGTVAEWRLIDAMVIARSPKFADAVEPLTKLAADYPGERMIQMLLGQIYAAAGKNPESEAAFEKAKALDATTPRVHAFLANQLIMKGDYAGALTAFDKALKMMPPGGAAGPIRYGEAFAYLYEGKVDEALARLQRFVDEYKNAGAPFGLPEVFIWNSIARINLENGRYAEAMKAYEKGYESVPGSGLEETQKKIWLGRFEHGRARTLARMGRMDEAWTEAQKVRKAIDEGGDQAKQFEPAWNYLAGYLKLEAGDPKAAVEYLTRSNPQDPFHRLLLARAYERLGDTANAKKTYQEVVDSTTNNLERALAYPEARKKLSTL